MKRIMFIAVTVLLMSAPMINAHAVTIPDQNVFEVVFSIDGVKYSAIVEKGQNLEEKSTFSKVQKNKELYFNLAFQAGTFKCLPSKGTITLVTINTDLTNRKIPESFPYISENDLMFIEGFPVVILEINCYPEDK